MPGVISNVPNSIKQPRRSTRNITRSRIRIQSQSQPQSQSDIDTDHEPSWLRQTRTQESEIENSFLSISTASLPPKYTINIALPSNCKLSDKEENEYHLKGEEILSDAWRKGDDKEGKLHELRNGNKRIIGIPKASPNINKGKSRVVKDEVLWYTAGIKFPCVCSLNKLEHAYTPSTIPPTTSSLAPIPLSHDINVAKDINDLLPWHAGTEDIDLDPSLNEIEEFEITWNLPIPSLSQISNPETIIEPSHEKIDNEDLEREKRKWLKGKFKAIEEPILPLPHRRTDADVVAKENERIDIILPPSEGVEVSQNGNLFQEESGWEKEFKRRKSYWRNLIRNDEGYGRIWDFLPLPYIYPSKYLPPPSKRKKSKIPPYQLPRTYFSLPHPFHPNLSNYISNSPGTRVYWLIPIHGPVYIPYLNHPLTENQYDGQVIPSLGKLVDTLSEVTEKKKEKPFPIIWTEKLLLMFLESFLHPLYTNNQRPFGILSYSFSGTKPDPWIDLPTAPPPKSHLGLSTCYTNDAKDQSKKSNGNQDANGKEIKDIDSSTTSSSNTVVKPESGDHLRIYCSLKYSLELRTWLHNIKIPITTTKVSFLQDDKIINKGKNNDNKMVENIDLKQNDEENESIIRIFYKTRLTLVGERGEVLIVA